MSVSRASRVGEFVKKHEKKARVAFETFKLLKDFVDEPGVISGGQLVFGVLSAYLDNYQTYYSSDVFGSEWKLAFSSAFHGAIFESIAQNRTVALASPSRESSSSAFIVDVGGTLVGVTMSLERVSGVYVLREKFEESRRVLSDVVRKRYGHNVLLEEHEEGWRNFWFSVKGDNDVETYHSERTVEYAKEIQSYLNEGISRSVMVYGPPGTGKTTFVRSIIEFLGLRSMRLRPDEFSSVKQNLVYEAVELLQPEAVIIDDFDRIRDQTALLEIMEYLNRHVKVVFVTVNKRTGFDEAMKRPQRFDLMKEVLTLEPKTVRQILGTANLEFFDTVREWPVSYIVEFEKRRRVNKDPEKAKAWLVELAERQKPDADPNAAPADAKKTTKKTAKEKAKKATTLKAIYGKKPAA